MPNTLLIEPNDFIREGLWTCLSRKAYNVIAAVNTITSGTLPVFPQFPDLVIIGPGAVKSVAGEIDRLHVIIPPENEFRSVLLLDLTIEEAVHRSAVFGFDALLSKDVTCDVFVRSLELVMLGQQIFPVITAGPIKIARTLPGIVIDRSVPRSASPHSDTPRGLTLSGREIQALRGLVDGASNKAIAQRLLVSEATIKARVKSLLRKIGVTNRTQVALWATRHPEVWTTSGHEDCLNLSGRELTRLDVTTRSRPLAAISPVPFEDGRGEVLPGPRLAVTSPKTTGAGSVAAGSGRSGLG